MYPLIWRQGAEAMRALNGVWACVSGLGSGSASVFVFVFVLGQVGETRVMTWVHGLLQ